MSEATAATARASRRRRRRDKKETRGIKSPALGRSIFWGVVLALGLASFFTVHQLRLSSIMAGALMIGIPAEQVVYLRGKPLGTTDGGATWIYNDGAGAKGVVRFGPDGLTRTISCTRAGDDVAFGCPTVMGVALGEDEDQLRNRLGPPTAERFIAGGKLMAYADMGLVFRMEEYRVTGVTKYQRSSKVDYLLRAPWFLMP